MKLKNTTHYRKAVQTKDGPVVIAPGKTETIKQTLSDEYLAKLDDAGVKLIGSKAAETKAAETKKSGKAAET